MQLQLKNIGDKDFFDFSSRDSSVLAKRPKLDIFRINNGPR
jgi:hypothetical protein